ncbi:TolC family protein [Aquimarina agarilytica]|uniref:TolC family protein n=1 Tax=Aquimarina agarilytica TaxID=1087449 RepID=UPI000289B676|nr:TolC family protein [Aquimarina agarilytica]
MNRYLYPFLLLCSLLVTSISFAQNNLYQKTGVFSYQEFLSFVKKHHPIIKQANLNLSMGEANLLKSRGGFDPKIEIDYQNKEFKKQEYYDILNATFKIPTWYGVEFKANFEENTGVFLNPQNNVPKNGLYSAGLSVSALEGLLINDRMATLKKAKFFLEQTKAERSLLVNELIYQATLAYFDWIKATTEETIYDDSLKNAQTRFKATKRSVETGDKAAIDSIEAKITLQSRQLGLEAARLKRIKSAFKVSNFLWLNDIPLDLQPNIKPNVPETTIVASLLEINDPRIDSLQLDNHPKIQALNYKIKSLNVDKNLKLNKLLPKLDLNYNFISSSPEQIDTFNQREYKAGIKFSTPLFLRKERGDLKLAKFKLQDANYERSAQNLAIRNKINMAYAEINSLDKQFSLIEKMVVNYKTMLNAEERKFFLGESSLFLVNSREQKLINSQLKQNEIQVKLLNTRAKLFNSLGLTPEE